MLSELPIFPCNIAKVPIIARGFKSARRVANPTGWPLVGFATGAVSGIDVLDIDTGVGWYSANFDALPQTRAHQTQRACTCSSDTRLACAVLHRGSRRGSMFAPMAATRFGGRERDCRSRIGRCANGRIGYLRK